MLTKDQFDRAQPLLALGLAVILVAAIGVSIWRDSRGGGAAGAQPGLFDRGALVPSSVDTASFDGQYRLVPEESYLITRRLLADAKAKAKALESTGKSPGADLNATISDLRSLLRYQEEQMENFTIDRGVIRSGRVLVMELSLIRATIKDNTLDGVAVWHEDIHDPGDSHNERIRLKLIGERLEFTIGETEGAESESVILERIPQRDRSE